MVGFDVMNGQLLVGDCMPDNKFQMWTLSSPGTVDSTEFIDVVDNAIDISRVNRQWWQNLSRRSGILREKKNISKRDGGPSYPAPVKYFAM